MRPSGNTGVNFPSLAHTSYHEDHYMSSNARSRCAILHIGAEHSGLCDFRMPSAPPPRKIVCGSLSKGNRGAGIGYDEHPRQPPATVGPLFPLACTSHQERKWSLSARAAAILCKPQTAILGLRTCVDTSKPWSRLCVPPLRRESALPQSPKCIPQCREYAEMGGKEYARALQKSTGRFTLPQQCDDWKKEARPVGRCRNGSGGRRRKIERRQI